MYICDFVYKLSNRPFLFFFRDRRFLSSAMISLSITLCIVVQCSKAAETAETFQSLFDIYHQLQGLAFHSCRLPPNIMFHFAVADNHSIVIHIFPFHLIEHRNLLGIFLSIHRNILFFQDRKLDQVRGSTYWHVNLRQPPDARSWFVKQWKTADDKRGENTASNVAICGDVCWSFFGKRSRGQPLQRHRQPAVVCKKSAQQRQLLFARGAKKITRKKSSRVIIANESFAAYIKAFCLLWALLRAWWNLLEHEVKLIMTKLLEWRMKLIHFYEHFLAERQQRWKTEDNFIFVQLQPGNSSFTDWGKTRAGARNRKWQWL